MQKRKNKNTGTLALLYWYNKFSDVSAGDVQVVSNEKFFC